MADRNSYTGRLKDELKKNEIKIEKLEKQIKELQERLNDHNENCAGRIKALEDERERLKRENEKMEKEIKDLKESNTFLEKEMESTKEELKSIKEELISTKKNSDENKIEIEHLKRKLDSFELSKDELTIRQLCSSLQENMCKIVLKHHFDPIVNKSGKQMENYISTQIDDEDEQKEAMKRWEDLKKEINWKPYWIDMMYEVKNEGNKTAHPFLTEQSIERAKTNLQNNKELSINVVRAIDELTQMWKKTREKLPKRTSLTEAQAQGGEKNQSSAPRNVEDTSQLNSTYADKVAGSVSPRRKEIQEVEFRRTHYVK